MLEKVTEFLTQYALPWVFLFISPESAVGQLIANHPTIMYFVLAVPFLLIWGFALLVDFIKDSWKMVFGIALDIVAIFLFATQPVLLPVAAIIGSLIIFALSGGESVQKSIYAGITFVRFIIIAPFVPLPEVLKVVLVLVPICTIESFFLCITD